MKFLLRARWVRAVIGGVGLALIVGAGTSMQAAFLVGPNATLDQGNASRPSACRYTGYVPDDASSWAAQTFMAGISGGLSDVILPLRIRTPRVAVSIAPLAGDGRPVVSAPLASISLVLPQTAAYEEVTVSFPVPARVEAGKQYAIVLAAPETVVPDVAWKADLGSSIEDPAGTRCADGTYAGGRSWISNDGLAADADFFFQTYVVPARHVTVVKLGAGTGSVQDGTHVLDCGSTCSAEVLQGQPVTLTATADPGSIFSGWVGGGCTADPTCSFVVTGDTTVTANFARKVVVLTVQKVGVGAVTSVPAGIACGQRCRYAFVPGPVALTAKPSIGWKFTRWLGACRGTKPRCRLTLVGATAVTASFNRTPLRKK